MTGRGKSKGDRWERKVVAYLRAAGWPVSRTRAGQQDDEGDVAGDPLVAYELRDRQRLDWPGCLADAERHAQAAGKPIGVAVVHQAGSAKAADGIVLMRLSTYRQMRGVPEPEADESLLIAMAGSLR